MAPSSSSSSSSSPSSSSSSHRASSSSSGDGRSPFTSNTVDYTLDHSRAHNPAKPSSSSELVVAAETQEESQEAMKACAMQILEQAAELLRSGSVGDDELQEKSDSVSGSTVGKHLRHVLDHYRLFLDAIEAAGPTGIVHIDYDRRLRSTPIETSAKTALSEFERAQERLEQAFAAPGAMARPVKLQATTPIIQDFESSVGREAWFVALHSIHHFALARVILGELGVKVKDTFGLAPSTAVFREWGRKQQKTDQGPKSKL